MSFHPKLNSTLQSYATNHKENSFQVVHLGSDAVLLQGFFKRDKDQVRFPIAITVKPAGPKKTGVEIKIASTTPEASAENLEEAVRDLFGIIERGVGILPKD